MYAEYDEPKTAEEMRERYAKIRRNVFSPRRDQPKRPKERRVTVIGWLHEHNSHVILYHKHRIAHELGETIRFSIREIASDILSDYPWTWEDIISRRRDRDLCYMRHAIIYAASKERSDLSLTQFAMKFGGRDHTTILHSKERMKAEIENGSVILKESPMGRKYAVIDWEPTMNCMYSRAFRARQTVKERQTA